MAPLRRIFRLTHHHTPPSAHAEGLKSARGRGIDSRGEAVTDISPFDEAESRADTYAERGDESKHAGLTRLGTRCGSLPGAFLHHFWSLVRVMPASQWALAGSGWITLLCVTYLPPASPPRVLVVFGFVLFCPGFAVARLVPTRASAERWVLTVALSMSFGLLVSLAFTMMRDDSVPLRIGSLALITTLAVLLNALVSSRRRISVASVNEKEER